MLLSQIEDKEKEIMKYNKLYNELKYEKATQHYRYLELEKVKIKIKNIYLKLNLFLNSNLNKQGKMSKS